MSVAARDGDLSSGQPTRVGDRDLPGGQPTRVGPAIADLTKWPRRIPMALIRVYQSTVGPALPPACRYQPTCSHYAYEAIERHGVFRGSFLAIRRLLRCHPWGGHGYDPVP